MKRIMLLVISFLFLVGCAKEQGNVIAEKQVLVEENVLSLGDDMESAKEFLGEDYSLTETKSCMYEGNDKVFEYDSITITTYPDGESDYISSIIFSDANITWQYDIKVGDSVESITSTLTEGNVVQEDYLWTFEYDDYGIAFYLENQQIVEIELYSL